MCTSHSSHSHSKKDSTQGDSSRKGARLADGAAHEQDHSAWNRKSFLQTLFFGTIGSGLMLNSVPVQAMKRTKFLNRLLSANNNRVLVLLQLGGGNDGLNTIIPVTNDIYYQKRPTIAICKQDSILLSDDIGMHPALSPLQSLWDSGSMNVINNVGYHDQNRSHGRSTDIWVSGSDANQTITTGWAGRFLVEDNPEFIQNPPEFPLGVRIGGSASLFQSDYGNLGVTFGGASQFTQFLERGGFYDENSVPNSAFGRSLAYTRKIANASFKYLESIQQAADNATNKGEYPDSSLANSLAIVAKLIRGGLPTKVYVVSRGGFDSHNNQGGVEGGHASNLNDVAASIQAFYNDLAQDDLDKRALTMTFSEFGRTLQENGSKGTDHGSSAPVLLFGPVTGGIVGEHANLQDLDNSGDPVYSLDYRSVYYSVLKDWFQLEPEALQHVISGTFDDLGLIATSSEFDSNRKNNLPTHIELFQNYPNPFNPETRIRFNLSKSSPVQLAVFDQNGRIVQTLIDKTLSAGSHFIRFNASALASGVYIYRLRTPEGIHSKTMTLIK